MAEKCTCAGTPTGKSPGEVFDDAHFRVYQMRELCCLLSDFAGQHGSREFTDGLRLEMFAVVFGHIAAQLQTAYDEFDASCARPGKGAS